MVHCQCGKFLKTQRWKVRDVTCDGVKIQKGSQLISSLMSVCIFPTMFQMLMIEVERVLQSKSSLQLYLCVNTRSQVRLQLETSGALLGTHITITVKANVHQSSSLPVFSSSDRPTRLIEELYKSVLFTNSHNDMMSWLMANGSTASSSVSSE